MTATITFYGGAGSVTGANFLLDTGNKKILIDCGAQQREQMCDSENSMPFAYEPHAMDTLIVTHAHQDHIGRIPKLVHDGFHGTILSTPATRDLAEVMFADSIAVMAHDAEKHGCTPLYDEHAVKQALNLWHTHEYHEPFAIGDAQIEFLDAGHVLGSAMVRCERGGKNIVFTGDLGNSPDPLLPDTESIEGTHYLVMESVYGDRLHEDKEQRSDVLARAVQETMRKKGTLLIPSFSLERTQIILFELKELFARNAIESIPVYLDAPLANKVTAIFRRYTALLNTEAQKIKQDEGDLFVFDDLHVIAHTGQSRSIHEAEDPKIIIAGAGMSNGGRIRAHEAYVLPKKNATVLFVGYQAPGSLGRRIADGAREVTIDGARVSVRAKLEQLGGFSGHRDRDGLMSFVETAGETLSHVFVVMGEPRSELFLAQRIRDFYGINAQVPGNGESATIDW